MCGVVMAGLLAVADQISRYKHATSPDQHTTFRPKYWTSCQIRHSGERLSVCR